MMRLSVDDLLRENWIALLNYAKFFHLFSANKVTQNIIGGEKPDYSAISFCCDYLMLNTFSLKNVEWTILLVVILSQYEKARNAFNLVNVGSFSP